MDDELALSGVDVLRALITRFCDVPPERIGADTRFDELPSWGSLPALQLLAAVEKECSVAFGVREFLVIDTVGAMAAEIRARAGAVPVEA